MRKWLVLLLGVVALVCSACVKADITVNMNDDGSGTFTGITAFNGKVFEQLGGLAALGGEGSSTPSTGDFCKDLLNEAKTDDSLDGAKIEPYKDGDFCGIKVTAPFKNVDEALTLLEGVGSSGGSGLEDVTLEKSGNGYKFGASWTGTGSGTTSKEDAALAKQFLAGFSYVVRIKLPGGQVTQNADLLDDNGAMVWNLDPSVSRKLAAQTDLSKPVVKGKVQTDAGKSIPGLGGGTSSSSKSSSKTWIFVGIGLLVVAGVVALLLVKRNKSKTPSVALAGAGAPVPPPAPAAAAVATAAPPPAPAPAPAAAPSAAGAPSGGDAPQWDAARNAYIQYDRVNQRWMQYDQAAATWRPIE